MSKLIRSGNFSGQGSGRHTPKMSKGEEHIIHRSNKMVLVSLNPADEKAHKEHLQEVKTQGWNSALTRPYKPMGEQEQVFEAFSAVKESLEQPIRQQETQLRIRMYKHMPQLATKRPERTLAILNEHKAELNEMRKHTQIEKKKGMLKKGDIDDKEPDTEIKASGNEMLFTPSLKNLAQTTDGSRALKQEVLDSNLRLKAVRHGMRIVDVAPPHSEEFYIPIKKNYMPPVRPGDKQQQPRLAKSATRRPAGGILLGGPGVESTPRHSQILSHSFRQNQSTPHAASLLSPGSIKHSGGASFFMTDVKSGYSTHADTAATKMPSIVHPRGASLELGTTVSSMEHSKASMSPRPSNLQSILQPLVLSGRLSLKKHMQVMKSMESNTLPFLDKSASSDHSRRPLRSKEAKRIGQLKEKYLSEDKVKVLPTEWLPGEGEDDMRFHHAQTKEVSLVDNKPVSSYINMMSLKDFLKREKPKMLGSSIQTVKKQDLLIKKPDVNYHEHLLQTIDEYQNPVDRKKLKRNPVALRMSVLFDPGYTMLQQQRQEQMAKAKQAKESKETTNEPNSPRVQLTKEDSKDGGSKDGTKDKKEEGEPSVMFQQIINPNQDTQQLLMSTLASQTFGSALKDNFQTMNTRLMGGDQTITSMPDGGMGQANTPSKSQSRLQKLLDQQEMKSLEKGGYYAGILREIFNPTDKQQMNLDSVYQLKNLCKDYYHKKKEMRAQLVSQLDVMAKDRPKNIQVKRKFFQAGNYSKNIMLDIDCMRMLAEVERVDKFKSIAQRGALLYYRVLHRVVDEEIKLVPMVFFIADYLRRLVENGIRVEREHIWKAFEIVRGQEASKELENFVTLVLQEIEELDQ